MRIDPADGTIFRSRPRDNPATIEMALARAPRPGTATVNRYLSTSELHFNSTTGCTFPCLHAEGNCFSCANVV